MRQWLSPFVLAFALAAGCAPPSGLCERVTCGTGRVCDPNNGQCVRSDGGELPDAGRDAGNDAGTDAGTDGGIACVPACSAAQRCDPSKGTCVACLTDRDCSCPTPICVQGACLAPVVDPDAGTVAPIPGESCASAAPLAIGGCALPRSVTFRVDLAPHSDDHAGVCSATLGLGRDVVFQLRLDGTYDVGFSAAPVAGSMAQPVVYLRKFPCATGQELACTSGGGGTAAATLKSRVAGDYALFVDTIDAAGGGLVDVTVTLSAPTAPGNESCLTADEIATDGGPVVVNLRTATDDEPTSCNSGGNESLDAVWRFALPVMSDVVAIARAVDPDGGVTPIIEIRSASCRPADQRGCAGSSGAGTAALRVRSLAAGTYYAVVEAYDAGVAGPVAVSISAQQPSPPLQHDTCIAPFDLTFADAGTFLEFDVDTSSATDDEDGTCNAVEGGPEYVYHLRFNSGRNVIITATPPNSTVDPVIYTRRGDCAAGAETFCEDTFIPGVPEQITGFFTAGDYYLFVEGFGALAGPMHVTVSATP